MGSFFTNIHVHLPSDRQRGIDAISHALTVAAAEDGFLPASAAETADRTILIAETASPDWVVVYDETSDGMDQKAVEQLARAVSSNTTAVSVLVHDSDDLVVSLFRNARRRDRLVFNPADGRPSPRPSAWRPLLADRTSHFVNAFAEDTAFAEDPFQRLAQLLAWDQEYAFLGYRHRDELPRGPSRVLPFSLRPDLRFYTFSAAPPLLRPELDSTRNVLLAVGASLDGLGCGANFQNYGGPSRGLTIALEYSPAVEEYLEIRGFRVSVGGPGHETFGEAEEVSGNEQRYLRARFPDVELPPRPIWSAPLRDWQSMKIFDLCRLSGVRAVIVGDPKKAGRLTANLWAFPHANPQDGATRVDLNVEIRPGAWWSHDA